MSNFIWKSLAVHIGAVATWLGVTGAIAWYIVIDCADGDVWFAKGCIPNPDPVDGFLWSLVIVNAVLFFFVIPFIVSVGMSIWILADNMRREVHRD